MTAGTPERRPGNRRGRPGVICPQHGTTDNDPTDERFVRYCFTGGHTFSIPVIHGIYGYNWRDCRCLDCRNARRVAQAALRARKRKRGSGIFSRAATSRKAGA